MDQLKKKASVVLKQEILPLVDIDEERKKNNSIHLPGKNLQCELYSPDSRISNHRKTSRTTSSRCKNPTQKRVQRPQKPAERDRFFSQGENPIQRPKLPENGGLMRRRSPSITKKRKPGSGKSTAQPDRKKEIPISPKNTERWFFWG